MLATILLRVLSTARCESCPLVRLVAVARAGSPKKFLADSWLFRERAGAAEQTVFGRDSIICDADLNHAPDLRLILQEIEEII